MTVKKIALQSGIAFTLLLTFCAFFSKTFIYYITPKVLSQYPRPGVIDRSFTLPGSFSAPEKCEVTLEEAGTNPIKIKEIKAERGDRVEAGDVIATAEVDEKLLDQLKQAQKQYELAKISSGEFDNQVRNSMISLEKQIAVGEDKIRTLEQTVREYEEKYKRENGTDFKLAKAQKELELGEKELEILEQQSESQWTKTLIELDRQLVLKEEGLRELQKTVRELEEKVKNDTEAEYQLKKARQERDIARREITALSADYDRQYEKMLSSNKKQIAGKKDEINTLLQKIMELSDIRDRTKEEEYLVTKALNDLEIAKGELSILERELESESYNGTTNFQKQMASAEDRVRTLELQIRELEDRETLSEENNFKLNNAKTELELAIQELGLLRRERLRQAESGQINAQKQLLSKQEEVESLRDTVTRLEGGSETAYQLSKAKKELELAEREKKLLDRQAKDLKADRILQGRSGSTVEDELKEAREKFENISAMVEKLTKITAEQSGVLGDFSTNEGEQYKGDRPLYSILPSGLLEIHAPVTGEAMDYMKEGMECSISYGGVPGQAKILRLNERRGDNGFEMDAVIEVDEKFFRSFQEPLLLMGRSVQATVLGNNSFAPLVIPNSGVTEEGGEKKVYVVKKKEGFWGEEYYVEQAAITVTDSNSKNSAVQGLKADEKIVTGWDRPLKDKQRVLDLSE